MAKQHYRYLYFTMQDTGAYEKYFEGLSERGLHLQKIAYNRLAVLEEGKPEKRQYCIFYSKSPYDMTRQASDTAEGISYKGKRGFFQFFSIREDVDQSYVIQKQQQAQEQLYHIAKSSKWMGLMAILYLLLMVLALLDNHADAILSNSTLVAPYLQMLVGLMFALIGYLGYKKTKKYTATTYTVSSREAKWGGCLQYVLLIGVWGMVGIIWCSEEIFQYIGLLIFLPWIAFMILGTQCATKKLGVNPKYVAWVQGGMALLFVIVGIPLTVWLTFTYTNDEVRKQQQVMKVNPITLSDFATYGQQPIRKERIRTGHSLCVDYYYDYTLSMENYDRLEANFFAFKTEELATWYIEEAYLKEERDTWTVKTDTGYEVDKVFLEENRDKLLLQKGNRVLAIDTDVIDFFAPSNQAVIEAELERVYE